MSSLIDPLIECWIVNDTSLSDNDSNILVVYLVLRIKTLKMSCMSTLFFDTRLIALEVLDLAQPVIGISSQSYEDY